MEIMLPVWTALPRSQVAASKLGSLQGATVALVDDNYDEDFTAELEVQLREQFKAIVKRFAKPSGSHPSPSSLIEEAALCDVAVVGIGM
jgi:hypothetical protein